MRHCNSALAGILLAVTALSLAAQLPHVPTVLIPVSVFTKNGSKVVGGLKQESFQVYEGDAQQAIASFGDKDAPVSVGILLDLSGSMTSKLLPAREAILRFIKASNPRDEFFVIGFSGTPEVIQDFTTSFEEIQTRLAGISTAHRTALFDAVDLGLEKMKDAHFERKALLIVSHGVDNHSHTNEKNIRTKSGLSNVEIYAMGLFDPYAATPEERTGPLLLRDLCDDTGGSASLVADVSQMNNIAENISTELRTQYVLGYTPHDLHGDGKWRKVKVKLNPPQGLPPVTVHARTGYYAPLQ